MTSLDWLNFKLMFLLSTPLARVNVKRAWYGPSIALDMSVA